MLDSQDEFVIEVIHITENTSLNPASIWCPSCDAPFIRLNSSIEGTNASILVCMGEVGIVLNSIFHHSPEYEFAAEEDYLDELNNRQIPLVHADDFKNDRKCDANDALALTSSNVVGVTCKECWEIGGVIHPVFYGNCNRSTLGMRVLGNSFSSVPYSNWRECQECLGLYERLLSEGHSVAEISFKAISEIHDVLDRLTLDALQIVEKYVPAVMKSYRDGSSSKTQAISKQGCATLIVVLMMLFFVTTCGM